MVTSLDAVEDRARPARRSYIEVPTMDDRKWAKIPSIPADVFMIDMEDTVPPGLKEAARRKVAEAVANPAHFGEREIVCRVNNLSTPWGRDDLEAVGEAGSVRIVYPKARTGQELREVYEILLRFSPQPEVIAIVETPHAVLRLEEIATSPGVTGLLFGPGDLALETGTALFNGGAAFNDGFTYAKSKMLIAAKAFGLEAIEPLLVSELKDVSAVRRALELSQLFGFDANLTFYPPHVEVINEGRTPTTADMQWNARVVHEYESALKEGKAAVVVEGQWVTVHQYSKAQRQVALARSLGFD